MTCLNTLRRIANDGRWHSLPALSRMTGYPQTSVSARLRELRQLGYTVDRLRETDKRTFRYRVIEGRTKERKPKTKCKCKYCGCIVHTRKGRKHV